MTFAMFMAASQAEQGIHHRQTGRRAALKNLLVDIANLLGPNMVLAIGGIIIALMVLWLVVRIKKRTGLPAESSSE